MLQESSDPPRRRGSAAIVLTQPSSGESPFGGSARRGVRTGDAHIIRNAGGLATDDAIRSLVISQNLIGTEEVIVIEHTGCGMLTFTDDAVQADLARRTGTSVDLPLLAFPDLDANLRAQIERIRSHPWIKDVPVHGLIYEVETGRLREVV